MFKGNQPLCRYCGLKISKYTETHYIEDACKPFRYQGRDAERHHYVEPDQWPKSKADAQKLTNAEVVAVRYHQDYEIGLGYKPTKKMWNFTTWDGQSYVDEFFCNGDHAKRFAYVIARDGWGTKKWREEENKREELCTK